MSTTGIVIWSLAGFLAYFGVYGAARLVTLLQQRRETRNDRS